VPFFIVMVVLNVAIIALIINLALFLPFLPERFKDTGTATAIRTAFIGLLLFVPFLIVIRETQRASVRGTAVELSPNQFSRALPDGRRVRKGVGPISPAGHFSHERQWRAQCVCRTSHRS
jgi:hypothetical protein